MEIKRQSIAFNIINNFKETQSNPIESITSTLNENFNKGLVDELTTNQAFEELDNLIEKGMGGHKYFKREGYPGNYKYYYTEAEYRAAKGKKTEGEGSSEIIEKDGKRYKLQSNGKYLEVSEHGMTKKDFEREIIYYQKVEENMGNEISDRRKAQDEQDKYHSIASKLSDKEFTKEELENKDQVSNETNSSSKSKLDKIKENINNYGVEDYSLLQELLSREINSTTNKQGTSENKDSIINIIQERLRELKKELKEDRKPEFAKEESEKEGKEDYHDPRFKFKKGTDVSFHHKDGVIQGKVSDYDYNSVTFKKEYNIDYKKDGKTFTMIGVPEDKIQAKGGGKEESPSKPVGELTFLRSFGHKMNEVRYWEDEQGNIWRDPHPKIDKVPGNTLVFDSKASEGDKSFKYNGTTIQTRKDTSGGQNSVNYKAPDISDKWWWDLDKLKQEINKKRAAKSELERRNVGEKEGEEKEIPVINELKRVGLDFELDSNNKVSPIKSISVPVNQSDNYYKKINDVIDRYNLRDRVKHVPEEKISLGEDKTKNDQKKQIQEKIDSLEKEREQLKKKYKEGDGVQALSKIEGIGYTISRLREKLN